MNPTSFEDEKEYLENVQKLFLTLLEIATGKSEPYDGCWKEVVEHFKLKDSKENSEAGKIPMITDNYLRDSYARIKKDLVAHEKGSGEKIRIYQDRLINVLTGVIRRTNLQDFINRPLITWERNDNEYRPLKISFIPLFIASSPDRIRDKWGEMLENRFARMRSDSDTDFSFSIQQRPNGPLIPAWVHEMGHKWEADVVIYGEVGADGKSTSVTLEYVMPQETLKVGQKQFETKRILDLVHGLNGPLKPDLEYIYWWASGVKAYRDGDYEQSLEMFNRIASSDAEVLFRKGVALLELGRREEAIDCFESVLKLEANHFKSVFNLALIGLGEEGNQVDSLSEAIKELERLDLSEVTSEERALINYNLACYYDQIGDHTQALKYARQAHDEDEQNELYREALGVSHYKQFGDQSSFKVLKVHGEVYFYRTTQKITDDLTLNVDDHLVFLDSNSKLALRTESAGMLIAKGDPKYPKTLRDSINTLLAFQHMRNEEGDFPTLPSGSKGIHHVFLVPVILALPKMYPPMVEPESFTLQLDGALVNEIKVTSDGRRVVVDPDDILSAFQGGRTEWSGTMQLIRKMTGLSPKAVANYSVVIPNVKQLASEVEPLVAYYKKKLYRVPDIANYVSQYLYEFYGWPNLTSTAQWLNATFDFSEQSAVP